MEVLVASLLLITGIVLYFIFKSQEKVATVETNKQPLVKASLNSEQKAEITTKPVVKRVYKKKETSEGNRDKGTTEEESKQ